MFYWEVSYIQVIFDNILGIYEGLWPKVDLYDVSISGLWMKYHPIA